MYDPLCTFLARTVETVVVSVDYAMAPEHHAPKAAHDSVDSVRWLGEHADSLGGGASRLAVSGDSAGGNLAAIVCQVVRDEGGADDLPPGLAVSRTDATRSQPSIVEQAREPILKRGQDRRVPRPLSRSGRTCRRRPAGLAPVGGQPRESSARAGPEGGSGSATGRGQAVWPAAGCRGRTRAAHQQCRYAARVRELAWGDDHWPPAPRQAGLRAAPSSAP